MKDASSQKITRRTSEGKPLVAKGEPGITMYPAGRILIHKENFVLVITGRTTPKCKTL
ncbi:hypothetical protein SESBI_35771 [Sesbania bispinosa]|nr:hypothetical protein SESBI_35771 [Sesbania bispinosa]